MEKAQEIEMLKEFSDANATSGFEEEFVKLFTSYAEKTANIETDGMLNVYASKKENKGNRPVIQLDAHSDHPGRSSKWFNQVCSTRRLGKIQYPCFEG